ncbi:acyl-CoA N-acyltransferase [Trichoderma ceciliae]
MATYAVAPCSVSDCDAISRNNMTAFWEIPNWVLTWRHTTLEQHIITTSKRYPRRLISDRETSRHQKAIDPKTGRLLGYARWVLPASHTTAVDGEPTWPEAMGPSVGPEEEAEIRRVADATPWNPNTESGPLDAAVREIQDRLMRKKSYLYLEYLAVHPENRGKGIATLLVQSGMKQAEKLGLDIFILACKPGWGLYSRLGFRTEEELIQDDSMYGGDGEYAMRYLIYEQPPKSGDVM